VAIFDGMQDFDSLSFSSLVLKYFGVSDFHYSTIKMGLNNDLPNFFNLNDGFKTVDNLNSLILIGTNPRFEASLLNTTLRKYQLQRAATYFTINPFADLKFAHNHLGTSVRTLISLIENRTGALKHIYNVVNPAVFIGVENIKGQNSLILQNLARFIGKKFFTKNKSSDNLGYIHSNITSVNMAQLGLDIGVRSDLHLNIVKDREIDTLFVIQPQKFVEKK